MRCPSVGDKPNDTRYLLERDPMIAPCSIPEHLVLHARERNERNQDTRCGSRLPTVRLNLGISTWGAHIRTGPHSPPSSMAYEPRSPTPNVCKAHSRYSPSTPATTRTQTSDGSLRRIEFAR